MSKVERYRDMLERCFNLAFQNSTGLAWLCVVIMLRANPAQFVIICYVEIRDQTSRNGFTSEARKNLTKKVSLETYYEWI